MYTSQDALFQLVKGLSPKEKKGFAKELRKRSKGKSTYARLFDALILAEHYDERLLKKQLQKYFAASSFSVVKNQINERLLNYLAEIQSSPVQKMHAWLEYIELLVTRALYQEADVYIERLKKEAKRHNLLYLVLEANKWKRQILQYTHHDNYQKASDTLTQEILTTAEAMVLGYKIGQYYAHVLSVFPQNPNLRSSSFIAQLEELKRHEFFDLDVRGRGLTFLPTCYLAMAKNFLYKFTGEFEKAYEQEKIVWELLKKDWSWFYKNKHEETLASTVNYLEALSSTSHTSEFREHMNFAEKLLAQETKRPLYLEGALKFYRFRDLVATKGENITDTDLTPFVSYYEGGNTDKYIEMKRLYEAYICRGLFLIRKYDTAIELYDTVIQGFGRNDVRQDYYENALFARLLFRFTLDCKLFKKMNMELFLSEVGQYVEHIRHKPKNNDYRFEYLFIHFFKALKDKPTREKMIDKLNKLEQDVKELLAENTPFLAFTKINFDFDLLVSRWKHHIENPEYKR